MKKLHIFFIPALLFLNVNSFGQILCINCYRQNLPVSSNISNMVTNGGFENSTCGTYDYFCPNSSSYNCDITDWFCTGGGTSTYAHMCDSNWTIVPEGLVACYMGNWYCKICSQIQDDTSCQANTGCIVTGIPNGYPENNGGLSYGNQTGVSLSQTVSGLVPGNVYVLEFWCGGEFLGTWQYPGLFGLDLGFGNTFLHCPPTGPGDTGLRYIVQFAATSTTHVVKFTNWGHKCQQCTEVILDDVRMYPINQLSSIIPACALGVDEADDLAVSVYQNHKTNKLEFNSATDKNLKVVVYNILSRQVAEMKFINSAKLNLQNLANGIYVYEIRNGSKPVRKDKFVVLN